MLDVQRRLSAQLLKCGRNRIKFDPNRLDDIKEAITKSDIRLLIKERAISKSPVKNTSRFWARKIKEQKSYGKQKGFGSRKGKKSSRLNPKRAWINKVRLQRSFIKSLRNQRIITSSAYNELYMKTKGGFFRSIRHLKLYTQEKGLVKK